MKLLSSEIDRFYTRPEAYNLSTEICVPGKVAETVMRGLEVNGGADERPSGKEMGWSLSSGRM